eukprot:gene1647-16114_t
MPNKKSKGRGRGRGRGRGNALADSQDVGRQQLSEDQVKKDGSSVLSENNNVQLDSTALGTPNQFADAALNCRQESPLSCKKTGDQKVLSQQPEAEAQVIAPLPKNVPQNVVQAKRKAKNDSNTQIQGVDIPTGTISHPVQSTTKKMENLNLQDNVKGLLKNEPNKLKNAQVQAKTVADSKEEKSSTGGAKKKATGDSTSTRTAIANLGSTSQGNRSSLETDNRKLLARPGYGTVGRPIKLRANFLPMKIPTYGDIYHYDVSIVPEASRDINRAVIKKLEDNYGKVFNGEKPVFDGKKNIYTKKRLPIENNGSEFTVKHHSESWRTEKEFKVTVKFASSVSIELLNQALAGKCEIPRETIQALELVLRMTPSARYTAIGRSFFSMPTNPFDLGEGCELWYAATAFYKTQDVLDFLKEILQKNDIPRILNDAERVRFSKSIKGLKVQLNHIVGHKHQKRILGIAKESSEEIKFDLEQEGKKTRRISVAEYFKTTYNMVLRFPKLPCLKAGSDKKVVHLPMEVCTIVPGQRCVKKLSEGQTAKMIRETAKNAKERQMIIECKVRDAEHATDPYLRHYEIEVEDKLVHVDGRVLNPPAIKHDERSALVTPREGKWDMRGKGFFKGGNIDNWGLLICSSTRFLNESEARNFCNSLSRQAESLGMKMSPEPTQIVYYSERRKTLHQTLTDLHEPCMKILLVILDGGLYAEIKYICDNDLGIQTQCIKGKNAKRPNPQLLANLCMKINAKVGGTNSYFEDNTGYKLYRNPKVFGRPVIFLGADVTHPAPSETSRPSIAAVVGSLDEFATKYAARVDVQGHRKEIIANLQGMTKELLIEFKRATGYEPERIIMYRDGVSEGQFSQVLQHEVSAVQKACRSLHAEYKPSITFMTVQKRHHVRLFPEDRRDEIGRSKNIPAGTVVDKTICHPTEFDFYLCSHSGIQGTSRPAHYRVLWDDSRFTADELQTLTYSLCHNYARCTRSVSIPPPAYYAHHVAMRARYHVAAKEGSSQGSSNSGSGSVGSASTSKSLQEAVTVHKNLKSCMYFI